MCQWSTWSSLLVESTNSMILNRLEISRRTRWSCLKCVIVYLARDIPTFVTYCIYGESRSSLITESTDSMILIRLEISCRTRWWCLKCVIVYLARDIPTFVTYCIYGESRSSVITESTDSMIMITHKTSGVVCVLVPFQDVGGPRMDGITVTAQYTRLHTELDE